MTGFDQFEIALRSPEPVPALRALVQDLAQKGSTVTELYARLEQFLIEMRVRPGFRERDEEAILDVLDALSGWCHPSAELLPRQSGR